MRLSTCVRYNSWALFLILPSIFSPPFSLFPPPPPSPPPPPPLPPPTPFPFPLTNTTLFFFSQLAHPSDREMLSLESDHYRHLPQMYHADALRDMDIRPNVNSLDLASPPPSRQAMRNSQPLTPPITPARRLDPSTSEPSSSRPLPRFIPVLPPNDNDPDPNPNPNPIPIHDHDHSAPPPLPSPASSTSIITDQRPSRSLLKLQDGTSLPTRYLVVTGIPHNIDTPELYRVFSVSLSPFLVVWSELSPPHHTGGSRRR